MGISALNKKLIEKARKYFENGKFLHSVQIYHKLINEHPDFIDAYIELAFIYAKIGKESFAEKLLRRAYDVDPENEEVIFMLGNICFNLGKFDDAIKFYTKLAHLEYPVLHYNLALAYYHCGDYPEAEEEFKKVLKFDPEFPKITETLAEILIERGKYEEAIGYLQRGIKKQQYNYMLYYLLAIALWNIKKLDEARKAIETAIDLEPGKPILWETCGEILLELGEIDEAERYFNRAILLDGRLANSFMNLGFIYAYRGKLDEANKFFSEALRIGPELRLKIEEKLSQLKNG